VAARSATGVRRVAPDAVQPAPLQADGQSVVDVCARPACRTPFTHPLGPGRPQSFCSELCRRAAQRELRQARSQIAHLEGLLEQARADLTGFVRVDRSVVAVEEPADQGQTNAGGDELRVAREAVARAGGVLAFLSNSEDPLAGELRALHRAVAPAVTG
jgi:hypothetical protein